MKGSQLVKAVHSSLLVGNAYLFQVINGLLFLFPLGRLVRQIFTNHDVVSLVTHFEGCSRSIFGRQLRQSCRDMTSGDAVRSEQ